MNVVGAAIRPGIITDKLNNAIATGNWGRGKVGVTQLLDRTNYLSTLSHLRRIQSPLSRSQPNFEARDLHATHFGRICPSETPEGSNCGLVKNLALSALISVSVPSAQVVAKLYDLGVKPFKEADEKIKLDGCRVFVEGRFVGFVKDGSALAHSFRKAQARRSDTSARRDCILPSSQRKRNQQNLRFHKLGKSSPGAHHLRKRKTTPFSGNDEAGRIGSAQLEGSCSDGRHQS